MEPETDLAMTVADWAKVRLPFAKRIEALLWPVLAYDVLVPIDEPSDFNIVQRAVLDLAFCGIRDPVVIADHLQLDPDELLRYRTEPVRLAFDAEDVFYDLGSGVGKVVKVFEILSEAELASLQSR